MTGSLLLGVDIGTSSSKGVLCTPDGEVLASHTIEHETSYPYPGWAEHDADAIWWGEFVAITRELLSDRWSGDDVGAVAVSAIGPCMLLVDKNDRPLRPGILYGIDSRAGGEIAWLEDHFGIEPMFAYGGMRLTSQAIGPKIRWLRQHEPDIFARTAKIHSASSYMVLRLTGEHAIDRHTASYFVPLFNVHRLDWDDTFAAPVIDLARLPRLLDAREIAGNITSNSAAETGLSVGTPVTVGTIDAAAEAISVGVADPGEMMAMYGSTLFLIDVVARPMPDPRMWTAAYALPNRHAVTGSLTTAGLLTRWFRDELAPVERQRERDGGASAYAQLADLAAKIDPGANGLLCLPYFAGDRTPLNDPDARGIFAGLSLRHTRAHLYRAVLEGIAYGFRQNLAVMTEMDAMPSRIVAVGGGARNRTWLQIMSDVSGVPQVLPERTIGASYGDAFLAGLASGIVPSLDALRTTWVKEREIVEPDPQHADFYAERYAMFVRMYRHTRDDIHTLAKDNV